MKERKYLLCLRFFLEITKTIDKNCVLELFIILQERKKKNLKTKLTNIVVERYLQCNHMYTEEIVNSDREHCRIFLIYSLWAGFKKIDCDKGSGKGSYSLRKHHGLIMEPRYWIRKTTCDNKVTKISMDWLVKRWNYTIIWGTRLFKALTMGVRIWI